MGGLDLAGCLVVVLLLLQRLNLGFGEHQALSRDFRLECFEPVSELRQPMA